MTFRPAKNQNTSVQSELLCPLNPSHLAFLGPGDLVRLQKLYMPWSARRMHGVQLGSWVIAAAATNDADCCGVTCSQEEYCNTSLAHWTGSLGCRFINPKWKNSHTSDAGCRISSETSPRSFCRRGQEMIQEATRLPIVHWVCQCRGAEGTLIWKQFGTFRNKERWQDKTPRNCNAQNA